MPLTIPDLPRAPINARVNGGPSAVLFFDWFLFDNAGLPDPAHTTFLQWTVSEGSVDLEGGVGPGVFGAPPDQETGRLVDLGGSTGDPGKFETTLSYPILAGQRYNLTFDYLSTDGEMAAATVTIGDHTWNVATDSGDFLRFSRDFIADETTTVKITFQGDEGDTDGSGLGIDGVLFGMVLSDSPDEVIVASPNPNTLTGHDGNDTLIGNIFDDVLLGGADNDRLIGALGEDTLVGGSGRDVLLGELGADTFVFSQDDLGSRDRIGDFTAAEGDRINLRRIDAIAGGEDDRFTFVGEHRFSGTAGELRVVARDGIMQVLGDIDGDRVADFSIRVDTDVMLTRADFIL